MHPTLPPPPAILNLGFHKHIFYRDLIAFENECGTGTRLETFNESLNIIRRRHLDTVPLMAQAVIKLNHKQNTSDGVNETIQYFLDRLYTNR